MRRGLIALLAGASVLGAAHAADGREVARTLDEFRALNPALEHYGPLHEEWVPAMGIHWGAPGPHITLGVGFDDTVVVIEAIYPAEMGWQPWFDQPEGQPMDLEGFGPAYTQHIWITEPGTIAPDAAPTFVPLTLEGLTAVNPALQDYQRLSEYVPHMGYHYGMMGPGLMLAVSPEGEINAFELLFPAEAGWFPWFDQPEGQPMDMPGVGQMYTQHVYLVDPMSLP